MLRVRGRHVDMRGKGKGTERRRWGVGSARIENLSIFGERPRNAWLKASARPEEASGACISEE